MKYNIALAVYCRADFEYSLMELKEWYLKNVTVFSPMEFDEHDETCLQRVAYSKALHQYDLSSEDIEVNRVELLEFDETTD